MAGSIINRADNDDYFPIRKDLTSRLVHEGKPNPPATMKSDYTSLVVLIGMTLTGCAHHLPDTAPAHYNPDCYVNIYEHSGIRSQVVQLHGPSTYSSFKHLKERDWDNQIGSL